MLGKTRPSRVLSKENPALEIAASLKLNLAVQTVNTLKGAKMDFTHLDKDGKVIMVDVGEKTVTHRLARAKGTIRMSKEAFDAIKNDDVKKGNVFATAKIAGIMAAKNTSSVIPLCHPLPIEHVSIEFLPDEASSSIDVFTTVRVSGKTGVEMEAIHATSIALLTIYDMCKAIDKAMTISDIQLIEKSGGRSGHFVRKETKAR